MGEVQVCERPTCVRSVSLCGKIWSMRKSCVREIVASRSQSARNGYFQVCNNQAYEVCAHTYKTAVICLQQDTLACMQRMFEIDSDHNPDVRENHAQGNEIGITPAQTRSSASVCT